MKRVALAAVVLVAACGTATGDQAVGSAPPASSTAGGSDVVRVGAGDHVCLDRGAPDAPGGTSVAARPPLPAGVPAAVVRCREDVVSVRGGGQWQVRLEETAVRGVEGLLASTRKPSGASATESPWLIQTVCSAGTPPSRPSPPPSATRTGVEPYSRAPVCATRPPSCCAITWKP